MADEDEEKQLQRQRHQRRQVSMICAHMGLNVAGLCVALIARVSVLQQRGLSGARAAELLALLSSGVGAVEFLLNPITGKLSDAYGRKAFLMQAPLVSAILKLFVFLRPSALTIGLERVLSGAATTIGGSTACSSALADVVEDPKELGRAYASLGTATGLGVIIGPLLGGFAIGRSGSPKRAFAAGSLLAAAQLLLVSSRIQETLPLAQRKSLPSEDMLRAVNPMTVLKLFGNGQVVATLVSVSALQCFCEGKSVSDLNTYYLLNDAKFSDARRSFYITCLGVVMTLSGIIGRTTIQRCGMRGHTTLQNIASAIGFTMTGSSTSASVLFGALPVYAFGMERRAAMSSLAVKAAEAVGMGKGEFSAAFANLRAIAVGLAPLLYARAYSRTVAMRANPGRPYFLAAVIALLSELLHRTLQSSQLQFS